jgi:hypothetical protein
MVINTTKYNNAFGGSGAQTGIIAEFVPQNQ